MVLYKWNYLKQTSMYDLTEASITIKNSYFSHEAIAVEQIQKQLVNYLDDLVEEINNDPLYFFRDNYQFWRKLDKVALSEEEQQPEQLDNVA